MYSRDRGGCNGKYSKEGPAKNALDVLSAEGEMGLYIFTVYSKDCGLWVRGISATALAEGESFKVFLMKRRSGHESSKDFQRNHFLVGALRVHSESHPDNRGPFSA